MLTHPPPNGRRPVRRRSLRQQYDDFILERIEEYKDQLSRKDLLTLANEAVREFEAGPEDQLVLTEMVARDYVDGLIRKRLHLPGFARWRARHAKLRHAQQQPTHWELDADTPLINLARCVEDGELALIVGSGAGPAGFFLAAHEVDVLLIAPELALVEATESRAASEALANRFQALVVSLIGWVPDVCPALVVIDPGTLGKLDASTRTQLIHRLQEQTIDGGVHLLTPTPAPPGIVPITPDALLPQYGPWETNLVTRGSRVRWFLARKP